MATLLDRFDGWPRRVLCALCLGVAALTSLVGTGSASAPTVAVVVAARPVDIGATLTAADLSIARWPRSLRPDGSLSSTTAGVGRRVSGALERGEAVTASRLLDSALEQRLPAGFSAVAVGLADAGSAALVKAGDYVDLISPASDLPAGDASTTAIIIVQAALVAAVLPATSSTLGAQPAELVVAVSAAEALRLAAVGGRGLFASVRPPP